MKNVRRFIADISKQRPDIRNINIFCHTHQSWRF